MMNVCNGRLVLPGHRSSIVTAEQLQEMAIVRNVTSAGIVGGPDQAVKLL